MYEFIKQNPALFTVADIEAFVAANMITAEQVAELLVLVWHSP